MLEITSLVLFAFNQFNSLLQCLTWNVTFRDKNPKINFNEKDDEDLQIKWY